MIYITRPVSETHKTVPKTTDRALDNNMQERKSHKQIILDRDLQRENYKFDREDLEKAVENANSIIFKDNDRFEFKIHERTGRYMIKLIDNETNEVIKEIPPEKILDLIASIWDLVGILVDERG